MIRPIVWLGYEEEKRSTEFNRFYFGIIAKRISELTGYPVDKVHDLLKIEVLGTEVVIDFQGRHHVLPKHTRNMTTDEFRAFVDEAEVIGTSLGCNFTDLEQEVGAYTR